MNQLASLDAALDAAAMVGSHSFSWFGKRPPGLVRRVRRLLSPTDVRGYLLDSLVDCLYANFYCPGYAAPADGLGTGPAAPSQLTDELSRANAGMGRWDDGWAVCDAEVSHLRVVKQGLVLTIPWSDFQPDGSQEAVVGSSGRTRLPSELQGTSPGFYMAVSDRPDPARPREVVRLYWNVRPGGAVRLTAAVTTRLNSDQLSFQFKVLKGSLYHGRCDAAVLYFARADAHRVLAHAAHIHSELAGHLRPLTPVFTKPLAPGLGLAEQPGSETSFGVHRCGLVAAGILSAHERGHSSLAARRQAVLEQFEGAGLNLAALHLNPDSSDVYELPAAAGGLTSMRTPGWGRRSGRRPTTFLQVAHGLGRRLAREALWHEDRCTWVGAFPSEAPGSQRTAGPELYSGTAGIGLFLAELWAATGDGDLARTAQAALRQSFRGVDTIRPSQRLGLFTGWPGIACAAVRAGRVLGEEGLLEAAGALMARLWRVIPATHETDVTAGTAGAILGVAEMGADAGPDALQLAITLADGLLERAVYDGDACSWRTINARSEYNLTGLSHGAAGIGLGLVELWALTGDGRYREAGRRAFAYEDHWYDARAAGWPDLRGVRTGRGRPRRMLPFANFWCHGAAGIALSRLRAFELLREPRYLLDARRGVDAVRLWLTRMHDDGAVSFSLCHGLAGNAEALRLVSEAAEPNPAADLALVEEVAWAGVERHFETVEDWPCAAGGGPSPSLMLGLAGIGHFYLRLHDPTRLAILLPGRRTAGPGQSSALESAAREVEGRRRCQA